MLLLEATQLGQSWSHTGQLQRRETEILNNDPAPQGKLDYVLEPSMEEAEKREIHLQGQASDSSWVKSSAGVG